MALHDTDPNTTNRAEPMPQAPDQSAQRLSDGTTAITNKQDGSSGAYVSTKDATVKVNDGTYNRVSLGLLSDGSYGLKVSQPGFDVLTAADDELVFNSGQNVFKIVASGTAVLPYAATGTQTSVSVTHGLGYIPIVLAFFEQSGTYSPLPVSELVLTGADAGKTSRLIDAFATSTTVIFYHNVALYGFSGDNIKYYLLQETAN